MHLKSIYHAYSHDTNNYSSSGHELWVSGHLQKPCPRFKRKKMVLENNNSCISECDAMAAITICRKDTSPL